MARCLENKELFMYVIWGVYAGLFFSKPFPKANDTSQGGELFQLRPRLGHGIPRPRGRGLVWKDGKKPLQEAGSCVFFHTQGGTYDVKESFGNRGLACIPSMNAFD